MYIRAVVQALCEPDFRESLGVGATDLVGDVAALASVALNWMAVSAHGKGPGGSLRPRGAGGDVAAVSEDGGPEPGDAATAQFFRMLVEELKNAVGATEDAVLLVDKGARMYAANRPAKDLVDAGFLLCAKGGAIVFAKPSANRSFLSGLEHFYLHRPRVLRRMVSSEHLVIYRQVFSSPLFPLSAVTVRHVHRPIDVTCEELQRVLGISPKQAEVAQALMRGLGPLELARENKCSVKSVRFNLYELMRRLDCHSQAEVTNLLVRMFG